MSDLISDWLGHGHMAIIIEIIGMFIPETLPYVIRIYIFRND